MDWWLSSRLDGSDVAAANLESFSVTFGPFLAFTCRARLVADGPLAAEGTLAAEGLPVAERPLAADTGAAQL